MGTVGSGLGAEAALAPSGPHVGEARPQLRKF